MSASPNTTPNETPQATTPRVPHNPALSKVAPGDRAERVCPGLADVGVQEPDSASETCTLHPVPCNLPRPHCRAIKTDGTRCNGLVLKGLHLCWSHFHHRHPALADKDHISIPLLEDHASIRLVMTQIVHGLLSMKLDPARAKAAIWAAQVAAHTLPRPARLKGNEPEGEPVHRLGADHDGLISADPDPPESHL